MMDRDGQSMTQKKGVKTLTGELVRVDAVRSTEEIVADSD